MTPNPNEPVLDVNLDEYSLNGTVIGKTATDISAIEELMIRPLESELEKKRKIDIENALKNKLPVDEWGVAKLHLDENFSYWEFFKIIATLGFSYRTINYVIGDNFKDVYNVKMPTCSSHSICFSFIEILSADNDQRKYEIDCVKDYKALDLMLTLYGSKDDKTFVLSLNEDALKENGSFHGFNFYSFNNEVDLWKYNLRRKRFIKANKVKSVNALGI